MHEHHSFPLVAVFAHVHVHLAVELRAVIPLKASVEPRLAFEWHCVVGGMVSGQWDNMDGAKCVLHLRVGDGDTLVCSYDNVKVPVVSLLGRFAGNGGAGVECTEAWEEVGFEGEVERRWKSGKFGRRGKYCCECVATHCVLSPQNEAGSLGCIHLRTVE